MSTQDLHPLYSDAKKRVKRCRDVYEGQDAITAINKTGETPYFPMFAPADQDRYNRAIALSSFTNYTGHTVDKLVGAAFHEEPKHELSPNVEYMLEDADGSGGDLEQVATNTVNQNTIAGRIGLLVNYPSTQGQVLSKEEVAKLDLKASIHLYEAETITNWGIKNGKLHYVVLKESKLDENQNMFSHESTVGERVYYIADDGFCYQQFVEDSRMFDEAVGTPVIDFNGNGFTEIPLVIVGAVDNSPYPDKPPILDMANVNISHYQISVMESENLSIHGQTTLGVSTSHSVEDFQKANPNGIQVGANKGINLGDKGGFHTATAPESAALPAAKKEKVNELVALGANLIDQNDIAKTATESAIKAKEQTSIMTNVVNNVSDGIERCLDWAEQMMIANPQGGNVYKINTEFFDKSISPEMFTAFLNGVDRGMFDTDAQQQAAEMAFKSIQFKENSVEAASEGQ